jgi:two-component system, sensor histidine kinase PdtaS
MSRKFVLLVFAAFFLAVVATYISGDYESMAVQIWNLTPSLVAAICGILAVRTYGLNNPHAKAFAFMALGIFFWFLGDFVWMLFEVFLNKSPFPSVADLFYLLAYPLLLVGLALELKNNQIIWTPTKIVCSAISSLILAFIVFYFGILKAYAPEETLVNNIIAMAYGVGDLILIIFGVAILMVTIGYRKGRLFMPWLLILSGFFLILIADILFAVYREEYENFMGLTRNIDLGWILGFLLIAFGFYSIGDAVKSARDKLLNVGKLKLKPSTRGKNS